MACRWKVVEPHWTNDFLGCRSGKLYNALEWKQFILYFVNHKGYMNQFFRTDCLLISKFQLLFQLRGHWWRIRYGKVETLFILQSNIIKYICIFIVSIYVLLISISKHEALTARIFIAYILMPYVISNLITKKTRNEKGKGQSWTKTVPEMNYKNREILTPFGTYKWITVYKGSQSHELEKQTIPITASNRWWYNWKKHNFSFHLFINADLIFYR